VIDQISAESETTNQIKKKKKSNLKSKEVQQKLLKNGQHRRTVTRGKVTQCIQLSRSQKQSAESKRCSAPYPTNLSRNANKVVESLLLFFIIAQSIGY